MQPKPILKSTFIIALLVTLNAGCAKNTTSSTSDVGEPAQQIADVMASVDDAGGNSGSYLVQQRDHQSLQKLFARYNDAPKSRFSLIPPATAATCASLGSSAFTASGSSPCVLTRDFGGCTVGFGTFTGNVALSFSGATCKLASNGQTVTRVPSFQVTGLRGATLAVSVPAGASPAGQQITRVSITDYTFVNGGIQRVFTSSTGSTLFDFTTTTTQAIGISGAIRATRVMSGGSLRVTNNVSGLVCDYTPSNVTWSSTCNCAVSGAWGGSCSDGTTSNLSLTGCGTGTFTVGGETADVNFDRCYVI